MGSPPVFIWTFTNCNKRAPRQCSGHCIWSYLKNTLVNKWLHQPPQIRSNKTGCIYFAAELRAICGSLWTDYLHADPNALEMGIAFSLGIPQCLAVLSTLQVLTVKGEKRLCGEVGGLNPRFAVTCGQIFQRLGAARKFVWKRSYQREWCNRLEQIVWNFWI